MPNQYINHFIQKSGDLRISINSVTYRGDRPKKYIFNRLSTRLYFGETFEIPPTPSIHGVLQEALYYKLELRIITGVETNLETFKKQRQPHLTFRWSYLEAVDGVVISSLIYMQLRFFFNIIVQSHTKLKLGHFLFSNFGNQ